MSTRTLLILFLSITLLVPLARAAGDYPVQPVPFTQVHFSDDFWLPRMETNRTKTIPFAFDMCEETSRVENFKIAAGLSDERWDGEFGFNDSDVYKVIEGASYGLMVKVDPELDAYMDKIIGYIAAAQEEDGYLYTAWTARAKSYRQNISCIYNREAWDNIRDSHELYNLGHMYEAAVAHYTATGKRNFLDIAVKSANLVCDLFGPGKRLDVPGHQEIELGLVKLYRATGEEKYLNQAKWFLEQRGRARGGSEYAQNHIPPVDQREAVGHAVRANYMYSAMADVAALTGDEAMLAAVNALWDNVANTKLYVTGGTGARGSGEAYGDNYELPNRSAYCETCAAIANVYWNHRMFLLSGESKYIDVMERSLYNNVLSGVALDGMHFFYPNPLESSQGHQRSEWFGCACCPSNICRFMASVPGYVYAVRDDALYVNLFADSTAELTVAETNVTIKQETRFPWDGRIELTITPETTSEFALSLRIPDWIASKESSSALYSFQDPISSPVSVKVNPEAAEASMQHAEYSMEDGYMILNREWNPGDIVVLELPMDIRRVHCDERVQEDKGKVALQRGPLVYCLEFPDVEEGNVLNLMLASDSPLSVVETDILGGIMTIEGIAEELRRTESGFDATPREFKAIPYALWAQRGRGPMAVWVPTTEESANPLPAATIASQSKVTTSFYANVSNSNPVFVQDQQVPRRSGSEEQGFIHWWPHKGTTEWIQYDFAKTTKVSSASVYWFDDTGRGECRLPASWRILYKEGDMWKPVENTTSYKVTMNAFDEVAFTSVTTDAIRLEVNLKPGMSSGIQEWSVK